MNASNRLLVTVVLACSTLSACMGIRGGDDDDGNDGAAPENASPGPDEFCDAMGHLIVLLEPTESSSPTQTKATFDEAAGWFEHARRSAPEPIAADVVAHADAYETYTRFLDESGYRLDVVFSTAEGTDLAIETSHTLTPSIVEYVTDECGLSFGPEK